MTLAEIIRFVESRRRMQKFEAQQKASYDYILADLIGRSIGRIYSSTTKMTTMAEAYPSLFEQEAIQEEIQKKKDEASAVRFRQFVQSFNKRFRKDGEA